MKWMLDLNVLLDVLQHREPLYRASAQVLSKIIQNEASGCVPAHALTTIHYVTRRHADLKSADDAVDWLLSNLDVVPQDRAVFVRARSLSFSDFEDAALASAAEAAGCDLVVTRNVADFGNSPVAALTPEELLVSIGTK